MKIAVLVGSLRAESINRQLARAVQALAPDDWDFDPLPLHELPLYNQDQDGAPPEPCVQLKRRIEAADALLFVTPEYNRSMPGVLKNAIDIASRPYGKNSFAGKPAGVLGASIGAMGTSMAQQHLRNVLSYLDVPVLRQPEAYIHFRDGLVDAQGRITDDGTRAFLTKWVQAYVAFATGGSPTA
ncbi:NADPH-dependent FMN reductase [Ideonella sp.]|uniref:NADPH-dependent FMN reductase n=1 Tax=Ideonella sp. TaxID=1929293 RepID=UPI0035AD8453